MRDVTLENVDHAIGLKQRRRVRVEPYGFLGRKSRETNVTAYTWTVDGRDLADWVEAHRQDTDPVSPAEETVWLANSAEDAQDRISRLIGDTPPEFGPRTALLTCPECGDLGCGAFSAEIAIDGDTVEWRNLGYDGSGIEDPPLLYDPPLSLAFKREQYVRVLREALREAFPDEARR